VIVEYDGRAVARAVTCRARWRRRPSAGGAAQGRARRQACDAHRNDGPARGDTRGEGGGDTRRAGLGVSARTLTPAVAQQLGLREQQGVLVVNVNDGSRAEAAGLKAGDVIAQVDHRR